MNKFHKTIKFIKARRRITTTAMSTEELVQYYRNKGNSSFKNKNYTFAIKYYKQGLMVDPYNYFLNSNIAQAYLEVSDFENAELHAKIAIQGDKCSVKGYYRAARAASGQGHKIRAIEYLKDGIRNCIESDYLVEYLHMLSRDDSKILLEEEKKKCVSSVNFNENYIDDVPSLVSDTDSESNDGNNDAGSLQNEKLRSQSLSRVNGTKNIAKISLANEQRSASVSRGNGSTSAENLQVKKRRKRQRKKKLSSELGDILRDPFLNTLETIKKEDGIQTKTADQLWSMLRKDLQTLLKEGSEILANGLARNAIEKYKAALDMILKHSAKEFKLEEIDVVVIKYALCVGWIELASYGDIVNAVEYLKDIEESRGSKFPAVFYGLATAYYKLNRYKIATDYMEKGLLFLNRQVKFGIYSWPGTNNIIPETRRNELKELLTELNKTCRAYHEPNAICRYSECLRVNSHIVPSEHIFYSDPDFCGFIIVFCEEKCKIEYHIGCWKEYKETVACNEIGKLSDKDFLGRHCPTTDCITPIKERSVIIRIDIIGDDTTIKASLEAPKTELGVAETKKSRKKKNSESSAVEKSKSKSHPKNKKNTVELVHQTSGLEDTVPAINDEVKDLTNYINKIKRLRDINFGFSAEAEWNPQKLYFGRKDIQDLDHFLSPEYAEESEDVRTKKEFVFSYFYEFIKKEGPQKVEAVELQWQEEAFLRAYEFMASHNTVCSFLLQSFRFAKIDSYICIADQIPNIYKLSQIVLMESICFSLLQIAVHQKTVRSNNNMNQLSRAQENKTLEITPNEKSERIAHNNCILPISVEKITADKPNENDEATSNTAIVDSQSSDNSVTVDLQSDKTVIVDSPSDFSIIVDSQSLDNAVIVDSQSENTEIVDLQSQSSENTVIVDSQSQSSDNTVIVDSQSENTVIVDSQSENTVIVDSQSEKSENTVIVDSQSEKSENTVIVDSQSENTVIVDSQSENTVIVDSQSENTVIVDSQSEKSENTVIVNSHSENAVSDNAVIVDSQSSDNSVIVEVPSAVKDIKKESGNEVVNKENNSDEDFALEDPDLSVEDPDIKIFEDLDYAEVEDPDINYNDHFILNLKNNSLLTEKMSGKTKTCEPSCKCKLCMNIITNIKYLSGDCNKDVNNQEENKNVKSENQNLNVTSEDSQATSTVEENHAQKLGIKQESDNEKSAVNGITKESKRISVEHVQEMRYASSPLCLQSALPQYGAVTASTSHFPIKPVTILPQNLRPQIIVKHKEIQTDNDGRKILEEENANLKKSVKDLKKEVNHLHNIKKEHDKELLKEKNNRESMKKSQKFEIEKKDKKIKELEAEMIKLKNSNSEVSEIVENILNKQEKYEKLKEELEKKIKEQELSDKCKDEKIRDLISETGKQLKEMEGVLLSSKEEITQYKKLILNTRRESETSLINIYRQKYTDNLGCLKLLLTYTSDSTSTITAEIDSAIKEWNNFLFKIREYEITFELFHVSQIKKIENDMKVGFLKLECPQMPKEPESPIKLLEKILKEKKNEELEKKFTDKNELKDLHERNRETEELRKKKEEREEKLKRDLLVKLDELSRGISPVSEKEIKSDKPLGSQVHASNHSPKKANNQFNINTGRSDSQDTNFAAGVPLFQQLLPTLSTQFYNALPPNYSGLLPAPGLLPTPVKKQPLLPTPSLNKHLGISKLESTKDKTERCELKSSPPPPPPSSTAKDITKTSYEMKELSKMPIPTLLKKNTNVQMAKSEKPLPLLDMVIPVPPELKSTMFNVKPSTATQPELKSTMFDVKPPANTQPQSKPKTGSNYHKLMAQLQKHFLSKTEEELAASVASVREKNNNSLSGLALPKIIVLVDKDLKEKGTKKQGSMGLDKFGGTAWSGVSEATSNWSNPKDSYDDDCSICMEPMYDNQTSLHCKHTFHTQCIRKWLSTESICPICRLYTRMVDEFPPLS